MCVTIPLYKGGAYFEGGGVCHCSFIFCKGRGASSIIFYSTLFYHLKGGVCHDATLLYKGAPTLKGCVTTLWSFVNGVCLFYANRV